ncbi:MAG: hypothetical protein IJY20_04695 [Clostridia bacterium]|nr:hypothetical protein [Clostridia bacterium]
MKKIGCLALLMLFCCALTLAVGATDTVDLQAQIDELSGRVSTLQSQVMSATSRVSLLDSKIVELIEQADALQAELNTLSATAAGKADLDALADLVEDTKMAQEMAVKALEDRVAELTAQVEALTTKVNQGMANDSMHDSQLAELAADLAALTQTVKTLQDSAVDQADLADLSTAVKAADAALQDLIDTLKTEIAALTTKVNQGTANDAMHDSQLAGLAGDLAALTQTVKTLQDSAIDQDALADLSAYVKAADKALQDLIGALEDQIEELTATLHTTLSKTQTNSADILSLAGRLDALAKTVEGMADRYAEKTDIDSLKDTLERADAAMQAAIDSLRAELQQATSSLQAAIDTKADATELASQIAEVKKIVENANESSVLGVGGLRTEYQKADELLNAAIVSLEKQLEKATADLQAAIKQKADQALLEEKIKALDEAILAAKTVAADNDTAMRTELEGAIEKASADLVTMLEEMRKDLQEQIDELEEGLKNTVSKQELEALKQQFAKQMEEQATAQEDTAADLAKAEEEMTAELLRAKEELAAENSSTMALSVGVASVAVVGDIALAVWLVLLKKRLPRV